MVFKNSEAKSKIKNVSRIKEEVLLMDLTFWVFFVHWEKQSLDSEIWQIINKRSPDVQMRWIWPSVCLWGSITERAKSSRTHLQPYYFLRQLQGAAGRGPLAVLEGTRSIDRWPQDPLLASRGPRLNERKRRENTTTHVPKNTLARLCLPIFFPWENQSGGLSRDVRNWEDLRVNFRPGGRPCLWII